MIDPSQIRDKIPYDAGKLAKMMGMEVDEIEKSKHFLSIFYQLYFFCH